MNLEETKLIPAKIENGERIHFLKTWTEFFDEVLEGRKPFELRIADRDYQVGDTLFLEDYNPNLKECTGRFCIRQVSYILHGGAFGLETGVLIMGLNNPSANIKAGLSAEAQLIDHVHYYSDSMFQRHMKADVLKAMEAYASDKLSGLRIAAVSSGGDTSVEPGPKETPELINVEALEKEGWESLMPAVALKQLFYKHPITVQFIKDKLISVSAGNIAFEGCKSMPDLRTLCKLVNGE